MDLVIKGKNIDVPDNAKEYIRKKAQKFDRRLESISKAKVEVSEEDTRSKENRYVVEVTVDAQGTYLRGEERGPDIFSAVDAVSTVMEKQIRRYKDRRRGQKRSRAKISQVTPTAVESEAEELETGAEEGKLIKFKKFPVEPMSADEAIDRMELLGHTFYLFFNADTEQFGVVYKRSNTNYGLIEPELT